MVADLMIGARYEIGNYALTFSAGNLFVSLPGDASLRIVPQGDDPLTIEPVSDLHIRVRSTLYTLEIESAGGSGQISVIDDEDSVFNQMRVPKRVISVLVKILMNDPSAQEFKVPTFFDTTELVSRIEERILDGEPLDGVTFDEFLRISGREPKLLSYILDSHPEYLNQQDKDGKTALIHAGEGGSDESASILLHELNADATIKDKSGKTAARHAREYIEKNSDDVNEIDARFLMNVFEEKVRPAAQGVSGLDTVSRHKEMGTLDTLPRDTVSRIAEFTSGIPGTLEQQRKKIRETIGKGRRLRKLRKRRTVRRRI